MTTELQAAAERWDEEVALEMFGEDQAVRDVVHLAKAYLALFPADDETLIDEAWLRERGFVERNGIFYSMDSALRFSPKPDERLRSHGWWYHGVSIPDQETRGQLRRLCAALGVELKEPEK